MGGSLNLLSSGAYEDLWVEIFKRLSIESLCKLRSVCKRWNSIISSDLFINLHHSFSCSTTPCNLQPYLHVAHMKYLIRVDGMDVLTRKSYIDLSDRRYANLSDECYSLCDQDDVDHSRQKLHFPFRARLNKYGEGMDEFFFVDVIRGVACISYTWAPGNNISDPSVNSAILWNPKIHRYVVLPCLSTHDRVNVMGFGYDASTNDFKIVLISSQSGTCWVYSALKDSWKISTKIDELSLKHFLLPHPSTFVNRTIHWLLPLSQYPYRRIPGDDAGAMLMFDCETEEFRTSNIPKQVYESSGFPDNPRAVQLFKNAGLVSALVRRDSMMDRMVDVWVMEEHGVSTSWKKLYVISKSDRVIIRDPLFEKMAPYGPNNPWNKSHRRFYGIPTFKITDRVYNQTMFLMDHPKAKSYKDREVVNIN